MKKKSVVNCVLGESVPSPLIVTVVLLLGTCLVYTHATGVSVTYDGVGSYRQQWHQLYLLPHLQRTLYECPARIVGR